MALPASWVESLFARLAVRYGVAFQRQYADMDIACVKADWAVALDRIAGDAIKGALENLPEKPPHAGQFRRLCMDAMQGEERKIFTALPAPRVPVPDDVRAKLAALRQAARKEERFGHVAAGLRGAPFFAEAEAQS